MRNIWLIAKREYLERVRTRAFLISTLMIPLLMVGGIMVSVLGTSHTKPTSHITIVSRDQQLALDLQKELENSKGNPMMADVISPGNSATRGALDSMLEDRQIDGYLWITPGAHPNDRPKFSYTPRSAGDIAAKATITTALRTVLMRERLTHNGMVANDVDSLMEPVEVDTTQAGKNAESISSYIAIYVLFFLLYMVILLYGMNVARSIIEEKTSRVFEILLATIRPEEMMAGKVIGVGSVGLTQVAAWLLTTILLTTGSWLQAVTGQSAHISLSAPQLIYFVIFFLLGYLLYSSIAAALGAMVNSEQELQQLNMFLVMPLAGCMFALGPVISNPSGPIARFISLIPFCTPLIMYLRISLAPPPIWEIALSILLMVVTIYGILWCASRIYRVGILMYGKRPNLSEIMRWLKYS